MNASLLCLVSALAAPPAGPTIPSVYTPQASVIRAQSADPFYQSPPLMAQGPAIVSPGQPVPQGVPVQSSPPTFVPEGGGIPAGPPTVVPADPNFAPVLPPAQPYGQPLHVDPFLGGGGLGPLCDQPDPPGALPVSYAINGLHPYRFGITHRLDFGLLPEQDTKRSPALSQLGNMGIFEFDYENEYTTPIFDRSVFSHTFQYGLRTWDGPDNGSPPSFVNSIDLPGNVHRFGSDFELTSPLDQPLVFQAGFNPSINTDFENDLTSKAWNLDARGVVFHRVSPDTTLVGGILYWDRVDDVILPYVGVIRKPSPRREYVLVFPNPRISYMVNNHAGIAKWIYVRGEYHVEAYQVERQPLFGAGGPFSDQIEIRDWRVLGGFKTVNPYGVSAFIEAGAVLGREVEFHRGTPDYDIDSGFIARAGLHF